MAAKKTTKKTVKKKATPKKPTMTAVERRIERRKKSEEGKSKLEEDMAKRLIKNKLDRQEQLREKLKGAAYITNIEKCDIQLKNIAKGLKGKTVRRDKLETIKVRIKAIDTRIDLNFKRLNKLLPDLKAMEHSDPKGNNPMSGFMDMMKQATINNTK